jgi:hypothetical protein
MAVRLDAVTNRLDFAVPAFVSKGETAVLRIVLFGTGGTIAPLRFLITSPDGQTVDMIAAFRDVSAAYPATFISLFELNYTFQQGGHYTFVLNDTGSGEVWVDKTFAAPWATNMDIPVSDLRRQRTDIERVYNRTARG